MASDWNLSEGSPLAKLAEDLPAITAEAGYDEMYGVSLETPAASSTKTLVILQKVLRANANDLEKAKSQLTEALKWRKEYKPLQAKDEVYSADKFGGLGFVTKVKDVKATGNQDEVVIFNIYGAAAKDPKKTFGDTDAFVRWRVALMEITLAELNLNSASAPVPDYGHGPDPYQAVQVHDYLSVSFFKQPAEIKASSSKIIELFQKYYPETVSFKYFVNIPLIMQWMMGAMKMVMSKDSIQKMTWLTYGSELHKYIGSDIPKEFGGTGAPLRDHGLTPKYDDAAKEAKATEASTEAVAKAAKE